MNTLQDVIDAIHYLREHCPGAEVSLSSFQRKDETTAYYAVLHEPTKTVERFGTYESREVVLTANKEEEARTFVRLAKRVV